MPGFKVEEIPKLIKALKRLIVVTIERMCLFPMSEGHVNPPKPYDKFVSLIKKLSSEANPRQDVSILTFNYDVAIDLALHNSNVDFNYCLNGEFSGSNVKGNYMKLLKLQGSLNWGHIKNNNSILPWELGDYFRKYDYRPVIEPYSTISIGSNIDSYDQIRGIKFDSEPVIVLPTWNKSGYHKQLTNVWSQAAKDMKRPRIFL